jgi:hypothetical protein
MENWKKAIINSGIMAGITFFSIIVTSGGVITNQSLQTAGIAFGITFLTLCSKYFRPPEDDCNDEEPKEKATLGQVVGCLWI